MIISSFVEIPCSIILHRYEISARTPNDFCSEGGHRGKKEKKTSAKVAPILNRNPCRALSSLIQPGGLNAATPGVEDTRNSQPTHPPLLCAPVSLSPPSPSLYFFLPLVPLRLHPPCSCIFCFLQPRTTSAHTKREREGGREEGGAEVDRWAGVWGERETISSRSSRQLVSAVVKSCHGQPSATTGELLSVGGGGGWATLSPSPLPPFSLSLLGNRDEWARVGVGSGRRSRAHPVPGAPRRGKIQSPG